MIKRFVGCGAALLFCAAQGCSALGQVGFDVTSQGTSTIPGAGLLNLTGTPFAGFNNTNFSQSQAFASNNTDKDHVSSARLSSFTLKVTSPSGQDLSFLTSISFKIKAGSLATVEIAHATSFPPGQTSVNLVLDDVELAPYVKADSFTITTDAQGTSPAHDTNVEADLGLHISASVL